MPNKWCLDEWDWHGPTDKELHERIWELEEKIRAEKARAWLRILSDAARRKEAQNNLNRLSKSKGKG